jgi:hypothetical protein
MPEQIDQLIYDLEHGTLTKVDGECIECGEKELIQNSKGVVLCDLCGTINM